MSSFTTISPDKLSRLIGTANAPVLIDVRTGDVFWSDRGELCTFDVMIEEFDLATPPLLRLVEMVRGADTGRPELKAKR